MPLFDQWPSKGAFSKNPIERHPNSVVPENSKYVWYNTNYEDLVYGNPVTYSFSDTDASIILPFTLGANITPMVKLHGLTLLSLSSHQDTYPVVGLGRSGIKGMTTGHRLVAGSLAFVNLGGNPFAGAIQRYCQWKGSPGSVPFTSPTELPPFDLSIVFYNSAGDSSILLVRSVKILDEAKNISVRDVQFTEVYSFMAANMTNLISGTQDLNYTPFSLEIPTQQDNPYMGLKVATVLSSSSTETITTAPTTTITTTTSTTTTSTTNTSTTSTTDTTTTNTSTTSTDTTTTTATTTSTDTTTTANTTSTTTEPL